MSLAKTTEHGGDIAGKNCNVGISCRGSLAFHLHSQSATKDKDKRNYIIQTTTMKAASINELKQELATLPPKKVLELCLRLARYKKENKELLTYLLFEAHNEQGFVESVKKEIDEQFAELPKATWYLSKKSLRKMLRSIAKYSKHVAHKESEVEMLIHFCFKLKTSGIPFNKNKSLYNLYSQQLKKLDGLVELVHEDLHFDYIKQLEQLR